MEIGNISDIRGRDDVTFQEYALNCAKQISLIHKAMRNSSYDEIPEEFKPDTDVKDALETAKVELEEAKAMSIEDAEKKANEEYEEEVASREYIGSLDNGLLKKYESILEDARSWEPPTDSHQTLKNYMIDELQGAINLSSPLHMMVLQKNKQVKNIGMY